MKDWSPGLIREQIVQCFTSDPDDADVRAVVVLHQDLELLPKDIEKQAAREATEMGEPYTGIPPYMGFAFGFDDDDRVGLFMDGDMTVVVREGRAFQTPTDAAAFAEDYCGPGTHVLPFENIPGLYQSAFMEFITGREYDMGPLTFAWTLPAVGDYVPMMQFPPKLTGD